MLKIFQVEVFVLVVLSAHGSAVGSSLYDDKYVRFEAFYSSSAAPIVIFKTSSKRMKIINLYRDPLVQMQDPPFSWPPTEGEESEIQQVLYGLSRRVIRLSVFTDIIPSP
ncbi:hypothetical protein IEQ34_015459 [Dendrobium chrysotoxum]|uniref:Uncharacterized protein n=1 Tax=Dendrobium chrysotoxum TaxID=161865 RepID=A0AAV7GGR1_DENCH|nr:hypothetical protein IEQ34_015459 [Dendrobium chrysotoxum]